MRLGHLASDLARIDSFVRMKMNSGTVKSVINEAKFFSEWAAPDVELEIQIFLDEIQGFLTLTELNWNSLSRDTQARENVAKQCRTWSDELLRKAGFFDESGSN